MEIFLPSYQAVSYTHLDVYKRQVLAVVSKEPEGTYGYKITQDVRGVLDISESTLYPVLRRLQKDDCLEVYDQAYAGQMCIRDSWGHLH